MDAFKCCILAVALISLDTNDISTANNPTTCDTFYKDEQLGWVADCRGNQYSKVPRIVLPAQTIKATKKIILDLDENNLAVLEADSFVDVIDQRAGVAIPQLELDKCNIESIDKDAFAGLEHQLETLFLRDNKLAEVPTDAFTPLTSLRILFLRKNPIERIGENAFANMNSLSQLDLRDCQISLVEKHAFQGLEHKLVKLFLGGNKLAEVPTDAIKPLNSLQYLSLQKNPIERIRENAFSDMESLLGLNLNYCQISLIEKNAFGSLDKMEEIWMEGNKIKTLRWEDFERLGTMKTLLIRNNPIEFDHCSVYYDYNGGDNGEMISKSMTVRVNEKIIMGEIYCSEVAFMKSKMYLMPNSTKSNLPPSPVKDPNFFSRSNVKSFAFQLSEFSCGYRRYTCEKEGKMVSQNEKDKLLADFGTSIVCNRILITDDYNWNVDCAKGNYTSIPTIILLEYTSHYSKTISINLSGNDISILRENSFANMTKENVSIGKLNLARSKIQTIEEGPFDGLEVSLIELDLSGNELVRVPNLAIRILVQLQKLILNGNSFAEIRHDSFPPMKNIHHLEMTNSSIERIDKGAFNPLANLQTLILDGNHLKTLPMVVFDRLERIDFIDLRKNPLDVELCWWKIEKLNGSDSLEIDYNFNVGTEIALRNCKCLEIGECYNFQLYIRCHMFMKEDSTSRLSSIESTKSFEMNKSRPKQNRIKIANNVAILLNQFTCNFHNFKCKPIEQIDGTTKIQLVPTLNELKKPEAHGAFKLTVSDEL